MPKVNIYGLDGKVSGEIELPPVFSTPFRDDLIRKDVIAIEANRRQPYGSMFRAGMRHSVETWGKGRGVARVQRIKGESRAAESPNNVGGRRAHPPRTEKVWWKKVNRKERLYARHAALAMTADATAVRSRGHRFQEGLTTPLVFADEVEKLSRAIDVEQFLGSVGVLDDIIRVRRGRNVRAGRGKMRNRRYRQPVGPLIVLSDLNAPLARAVCNFPGVEICTVSSLNTERLAPGGVGGRLVIFSKSAVEKLGVS